MTQPANIQGRLNSYSKAISLVEFKPKIIELSLGDN